MHDKINVCLLNDSFPPVIDGVANAVVNYGEIISTKNLGKATVVTPEYPGAVDDYPFDVVRYPLSRSVYPYGAYPQGKA